MKKALRSMAIVTLVCFMLAGQAYAITWHTANQATIAWDAVTDNTNGDPIPAGESVEYVVYLANAVTDPNKANPTQVWRGADLQAVITLNVEGQFFAGVKAVRVVNGEDVAESTTSWSDDPLVCMGGVDFGLRFYLPPMGPMNLRPSGG